MEIQSTQKLFVTDLLHCQSAKFKVLQICLFLVFFFFFKFYLLVSSHHHIWCHCFPYSMYFCVLTKFSGMIENRQVLSMLCGILKQYLISCNTFQVLSQLCYKNRRKEEEKGANFVLPYMVQKTDKGMEEAGNLFFIGCVKALIRPQGS